ncbi:Alpha/Beta hydrolase protein [Emericellopsis atlantica]|uniref:Alpha/Beta hydrolase protein n=1 Tax=Emericellopsis atlantica TaxID=2614577 RepID=A0A9P7ZLC6_9HYPO|nr:Alpha/Beta hydrolase protein [Emericellopsis atlantica]KAG9253832.1 Alpha/Beta hydrolase protein [Emericellopsis atlantica]
MGSHGFFQYWRLKFIVTFIRFLSSRASRKHLTPSPSCHRRAIRIPSRDLHRFIDAWIYYPPRHDPNAPAPVVVNWHGSGFIIDNLGMDHAFCERIAREGRVVVLDADYRKAPEYPFPLPMEDAEDVLRWVADQSRQFDVNRVALSGFSAGATMCLGAVSQIRPRFPSLNIRAVYAFYPGTDWTIPAEDKKVDRPIAPLPVRGLQLFSDAYVPRQEDREDPLASPLRADASTFLSTKIVLFPASGDVFYHETVALEKKLREGGCDVELDVAEDAAHGFDKPLKPEFFNKKERDRLYGRVVESLRGIM